MTSQALQNASKDADCFCNMFKNFLQQMWHTGSDQRETDHEKINSEACACTHILFTYPFTAVNTEKVITVLNSEVWICIMLFFIMAVNH
jgi:hypothetical protein